MNFSDVKHNHVTAFAGHDTCIIGNTEKALRYFSCGIQLELTTTSFPGLFSTEKGAPPRRRKALRKRLDLTIDQLTVSLPRRRS